MSIVISVPAEVRAGEQRVALVPEIAKNWPPQALPFTYKPAPANTLATAMRTIRLPVPASARTMPCSARPTSSSQSILSPVSSCTNCATTVS